MLREQRQEIATLRRQWMIVVACYGAALIAGFNLLRQGANLQQSLQWLLLSSMAMAIQLGILWWALPYNRRQGRSLAEDESPLLVPALGYANAITLLRGLFTCMLAGFLFAPQLGGPWRGCRHSYIRWNGWSTLPTGTWRALPAAKQS
jgi:hypothetical protein